jgi:hypothetical protein
MSKTLSVSVLAFLAGGMVGAFALNRGTIAQEPTPKVRVQPPRGEGRPGMAGPMTGGSPQITATGKFVYILRGNEILQFQAESMDFVKKVNVPPPERRDPPPPRDGGDRPDPPPIEQ